MSDAHLDLATLDAARTGEAGADEMAHLESCADCLATMENLRPIVAALQHLRAPGVDVPPEVDRRILVRRRPARRWFPVAAAAAVAVAALGIWLAPGSRRSNEMAGFKPGDVDRSGRVDILDAYQLALRIKEGKPLTPDLDFNGDGVVDSGDVDFIGTRSVVLAERND